MLSSIAGTTVPLDDETDSLAAGIDPAEVRERLVSHATVDEAYVLRTCQRFECYVRGERPHDVLVDVIPDVTDADRTRVRDATTTGESAVVHLFRVACGLESGVLGEDEILGQIREAYRAASEAQALEAALDTVVLKAIRAGERARTETAINEGTVSLGSVALGELHRRLGGLDDADLLVVGAGEVAELVVKALSHREVGDVTIANRTRSSAWELAEQVDGEGIGLETIPDALTEVDAVLTATGATEPVIDASDVGDRRVLLVDLANPADVAPAVEDTPAEVLRLNEVLSVRTSGIEQRQSAIPAVEGIIEEELERLIEQLRAERVDEALAAVYSRGHELRESELDRALARLAGTDEELSETQEEVFRDFSEALLSKLLHPKTQALKQAAARDERETADAWLRLFDEQFDGAELRLEDERKPTKP